MKPAAIVTFAPRKFKVPTSKPPAVRKKRGEPATKLRVTPAGVAAEKVVAEIIELVDVKVSVAVAPEPVIGPSDTKPVPDVMPPPEPENARLVQVICCEPATLMEKVAPTVHAPLEILAAPVVWTVPPVAEIEPAEMSAPADCTVPPFAAKAPVSEIPPVVVQPPLLDVRAVAVSRLAPPAEQPPPPVHELVTVAAAAEMAPVVQAVALAHVSPMVVIAAPLIPDRVNCPVEVTVTVSKFAPEILPALTRGVPNVVWRETLVPAPLIVPTEIAPLVVLTENVPSDPTLFRV